MTKVDAAERFAKDVANHEMTVERDDGVYRHLRFRRPGTGFYWFDVVTWPGYLCISGDMDCYVFSRMHDMFDFHRTPEGREIDLQYWAQKCQAACPDDGIREFSEEKFREAIEYELRTHFEDSEGGIPDGLRKAVERDVLYRVNNGEHEAVRAAVEFEHGDFRFYDFWEHDVRDFTLTFAWCCNAVAWAIRKYDEAKAVVAVEGKR